MNDDIKNRLYTDLKLGVKLLCVGGIYAVWLRLTNIGIPCVFHLATHLECPGCGMTRAVSSILKFDFASAFKYNPLSLTVVPLLLTILFLSEVRYIKNGKRDFRLSETLILTVMLLLTMMFGLFRNLDQLVKWGMALGLF